MNLKFYGLAAVFVLTLLACGQGNDRLLEKAGIEGKAAVDAENQNLATRAASMETDLEQRRRFVDSIVGTYEGRIAYIEGENATIRFIVSSSFPRNPRSDRTRTIEELTYELSNLHINVQVIEWSNVKGLEIASGCIFEQIRPDIIGGTIQLMSEACKMSYSLTATNRAEDPVSIPLVDKRLSKQIASHVIQGQISEVPAFGGDRQSNISSKRFPFHAMKVSSR